MDLGTHSLVARWTIVMQVGRNGKRLALRADSPIVALNSLTITTNPGHIKSRSFFDVARTCLSMLVTVSRSLVYVLTV